MTLIYVSRLYGLPVKFHGLNIISWYLTTLLLMDLQAYVAFHYYK